MKDIFKHRNVKVQEQLVYILRKSDYVTPRENQLPSGYQLREISRALLRSNEIENLSFLQEKILSFWDSIDHFLEKGFGYCIVHEHKIVSVCFAAFITNRSSVVDIETLKEYEGKKLAQIAASAYVQACLRKGMTPYWDCMKVNLPSQAVAERIGFKRLRTYYVHYFKL